MGIYDINIGLNTFKKEFYEYHRTAISTNDLERAYLSYLGTLSNSRKQQWREICNLLGYNFDLQNWLSDYSNSVSIYDKLQDSMNNYQHLSDLAGRWFTTQSTMSGDYQYSKVGDTSRVPESGKMYYTNGTTKYINYGNESHLNIDATGEWSICFDVAWTNASIAYLMSKVNSSSLQGWGILLNEASLAGRLSFRIVNTALTTKALAVYTNSAYNDGTVRRFVIAKSAGLSASTVKIYVNNVAVTTVSYWDTLDASPTNVSNFNIFGRSEGSFINSTSKVHGIMIYNKVLDSSELTMDYNGEIADINSLVFADTCECTDTANSYDSSSYGLVGAKNTWAAGNHVTSSAIRASYENEFGYYDDGTYFIPVNFTNKNQSADGNSLTCKGRVALRILRTAGTVADPTTIEAGVTWNLNPDSTPAQNGLSGSFTSATSCVNPLFKKSNDTELRLFKNSLSGNRETNVNNWEG